MVRWFTSYSQYSKAHALEVQDGESVQSDDRRLSACGIRPRRNWGAEVEVQLDGSDVSDCCSKCIAILEGVRMAYVPGARLALVDAVAKCIDEAVAGGLDRHIAWEVVHYRARRALATKHV